MASIHFEIHCDDVGRAKDFYAAAFDKEFEDWSDFAGMPYFGVVSGPDDEPGINGALMARMPGQQVGGVNGAVLTMGSADYDADHDRIIAAGGGGAAQGGAAGDGTAAGLPRTPRATSSASTSRTRTRPEQTKAPGPTVGPGAN